LILAGFYAQLSCMRKLQVFAFLLIYVFGAWTASAKIGSRMYFRRPVQPRHVQHPQTPPTNSAANTATSTPPAVVPVPQPVITMPYVQPTNGVVLQRLPTVKTNQVVTRDPSERPQSVIEMHYETDDPLLAFQRANAAKGFPESQYVMGMRYLSGLGVPQDEGKAREYLQAAASRGNFRAKEKLRQLRQAEKQTASNQAEAAGGGAVIESASGGPPR
jgi:hypothetical protein